jgi:hypothetical protein
MRPELPHLVGECLTRRTSGHELNLPADEPVCRPMLSVPLGSETSPVFGGEREISTRLAVLPFELLLRVRIGALGW